MKTGVELIREERQKQINKHGFTGEHHFNHPEWYDRNQLIHASQILLQKEIETDRIKKYGLLPFNWNSDWFLDLCNRPYEERLIIAGALVASEIDRLNIILQNILNK